LIASKDIDHWTYYDAILDEVHFEWPDPFGDTLEGAKADCIKYLDQIFVEGKYRMRSFLKRE
jgi:hypothetical protein